MPLEHMPPGTGHGGWVCFTGILSAGQGAEFSEVGAAVLAARDHKCRAQLLCTQPAAAILSCSELHSASAQDPGGEVSAGHFS